MITVFSAKAKQDLTLFRMLKHREMLPLLFQLHVQQRIVKCWVLNFMRFSCSWISCKQKKCRRLKLATYRNCPRDSIARGYWEGFSPPPPTPIFTKI